MQVSLVTLENQLEKAKERLKGVEENIKKNIGREINNGPNLNSRIVFKRNARADDDNKEFNNFPDAFSSRKRLAGVIENNQWNHTDKLKKLSTKDGSNRRDQRINDEKSTKKTVTVFSRLSGPPKDDDEREVKVTSQVIVQDTVNKKDILAAQSDKKSKERNKRMFGALLGTLQKFRQEENRLKEREQKKADIEKRLEEAAEREREEVKRVRQELFSTRRQEQFHIKQLEFKLQKLKHLKQWEATRLPLLNYIQTRTNPKIYYLPKSHNQRTEEALDKSRTNMQKTIVAKRTAIEKTIADHSTGKFNNNSTTIDSKSRKITENTDENVDDDLNLDVGQGELMEVEEEVIDDSNIGHEKTDNLSDVKENLENMKNSSETAKDEEDLNDNLNEKTDTDQSVTNDVTLTESIIPDIKKDEEINGIDEKMDDKPQNVDELVAEKEL